MKNLLNRLFEQDEHEVRTGRKLAWSSVPAMQSAIMEYFDECANNSKKGTDSDGIEIEIPSPLIPTLEGLALQLGIDRRTLYNYAKEEPPYLDLFPTIKRAKDYVLALKTNSLINGGGCLPGLIFDLKNNHGFADRFEQDIKTEHEESVTVVHEVNIICND